MNACQGTFPENRILGATNAGNRHRAGSMQAKARLTVNARGVVENADEVLVIRRDSCGIHTHGFMTPTCWSGVGAGFSRGAAAKSRRYASVNPS